MRGSELTLIKTWSEKPSFQFLVTKLKDSRFPLKRIVINQTQWKFQIFIIQVGIFVTKIDCYLYDTFAKFVPIRKLIEYSRFYLILCNNLYEGDNDLNLSIRTCLEFLAGTYFGYYTAGWNVLGAWFLAVNHHNHKNWVPSILIYNLWFCNLKICISYGTVVRDFESKAKTS